uniref:DUF148 domain-containing protein n=2 Tax=Caenorhabditis tropicalis TaxID=1561998 RepID=A0A1I7TMV9_9PELO
MKAVFVLSTLIVLFLFQERDEQTIAHAPISDIQLNIPSHSLQKVFMENVKISAIPARRSSAKRFSPPASPRPHPVSPPCGYALHRNLLVFPKLSTVAAEGKKLWISSLILVLSICC